MKKFFLLFLGSAVFINIFGPIFLREPDLCLDPEGYIEIGYPASFYSCSSSMVGNNWTTEFNSWALAYNLIFYIILAFAIKVFLPLSKRVKIVYLFLLFFLIILAVILNTVEVRATLSIFIYASLIIFPVLFGLKKAALALHN